MDGWYISHALFHPITEGQQVLKLMLLPIPTISLFRWLLCNPKTSRPLSFYTKAAYKNGHSGSVVATVGNAWQACPGLTNFAQHSEQKSCAVKSADFPQIALTLSVTAMMALYSVIWSLTWCTKLDLGPTTKIGLDTTMEYNTLPHWLTATINYHNNAFIKCDANGDIQVQLQAWQDYFLQHARMADQT